MGDHLEKKEGSSIRKLFMIRVRNGPPCEYFKVFIVTQSIVLSGIYLDEAPSRWLRKKARKTMTTQKPISKIILPQDGQADIKLEIMREVGKDADWHHRYAQNADTKVTTLKLQRFTHLL